MLVMRSSVEDRRWSGRWRRRRRRRRRSHGGDDVRGRSWLHQEMFGPGREVGGQVVVVEVVVARWRHPGKEGQAMALGEREGRPGQQEEENLRESSDQRLYQATGINPSKGVDSFPSISISFQLHLKS